MPPDDSDRLPAVPDPAAAAESIDTSYEIALDDAPDGVAGPVHEGAGLPMAQEAPSRLPVIPEHLRTIEGIRRTAGRHAGRHWHRVKFHGVRLPKYAVLGLAYAVAGACRVAALQARWGWLSESKPVRDALAKGDPDKWVKAHEHTLKVRRTRIPLLLFEAAALAAGCVVLALIAPWWSWAAAFAVAVPLLSRAGRPAGRPIITPASVTPRFRLLSSDVVLRAYYAAGLGHPEKPGQQVTFGAPGMRRDGDGSGVLVDLPYGKGLDDAIAVKGKIASGLDVAVSQVFIHRDPTSHRRHKLWVADRDPLAVPVGRTPLLACKATDIWRPAPFGLDERGQLVSVPLMWNSVLVSALPRQGKTFAARSLALYAALDPYVRLDVFDLKGSPDWRRFDLVADSYGFGMTPARYGLPLDILADTLTAAKKDVQERYAKLSELPPSVCPEGKLTREIARDPRYGMPVRVLVLDEFQELFDLGEDSKEFAALLVFLVKVAPAAGVMLVDATQRPSGIGSGIVAQQFTSFRDQHAVRFGLRTSSWQVSELCLGAGAYSEGLDTSLLLPQYKGVGILRGASDVSPTVRTHLADGNDSEVILRAARALRERAGTLAGMAAGESAQQAARDVLADVLAVFEPGETGLQWEEVAERLARRFPDRWEGATGGAVSKQCRDLDVPSRQVKRGGSNLNGCYRDDVSRLHQGAER